MQKACDRLLKEEMDRVRLLYCSFAPFFYCLSRGSGECLVEQKSGGPMKSDRHLMVLNIIIRISVFIIILKKWHLECRQGSRGDVVSKMRIIIGIIILALSFFLDVVFPALLGP